MASRQCRVDLSLYLSSTVLPAACVKDSGPNAKTLPKASFHFFVLYTDSALSLPACILFLLLISSHYATHTHTLTHTFTHPHIHNRRKSGIFLLLGLIPPLSVLRDGICDVIYMPHQQQQPPAAFRPRQSQGDRPGSESPRRMRGCGCRHIRV
jgi:hypothetical protein